MIHPARRTFSWAAILVLALGVAALLVLAALGLLVSAAPVRADTPPSPIDRNLWAFPGASTAPGDAFTASFAMADRWLGESPFDNAAAFAGRGFQASGALLRIHRQDLAAENHDFEESALFIDFGSMWLSLPFGGWGMSAYAYQPVLRIEENAFTHGEVGGPSPPATIQSNGSARELRAGLALSRGLGALRIGAAAEWQHRSDVYEYLETSGSPDQGLRHVDFAGDGVGFQAGLRIGEQLDAPFSLGASVRYSPAMTLEGEQHLDLLSGDSVGVVSAERESALEGGVSVAWRMTHQFRTLAGYGMRTERAWDGFGVQSGRGTHWSVAGEFHDSRDPWTVRFGGGQELEDGGAERASGMIGLGIGWALEGVRLDFGLLHRTIDRSGKPHSFDDRLLATVSTGF